MTEAEWLACEDPTPMLEFLRGKASDRKLRLFACACCRRLWHLITSIESSRTFVEEAERFADGRITNAERRATASRANYANTTEELRWIENAAGCTLAVPAIRAAEGSSTATRHFGVAGLPKTVQGAMNPVWVQAFRQEGEWQVSLLRDIFGNPFRPVTFSPSWRTDTALSLARQMYDARDFSAMPILADALQDAGCDRDDILNHCRSDGPHVRGCWVCDLVLGKS